MSESSVFKTGGKQQTSERKPNHYEDDETHDQELLKIIELCQDPNTNKRIFSTRIQNQED